MTLYSDILADLKQQSRLRTLPGELQGLDLLSNDYMGLAARQGEFMEEYKARLSHSAMSSSASRLLQRDQREHLALEQMLSGLYAKEILMMNSGYHANAGVLSALSVKGTLIISDKLSHASMIDGIRLGAGDSLRFPHNDISKLRKILEKNVRNYSAVIIATESVFSMDGDLSPLEELIALKKTYGNVLLYVDEAHGFGVFGKHGLGLVEELGVIGEIDIIIGTLGKAASGYGAFIATSEEIKSYLINTARSFIFSTSLPPSLVAWDRLMIEKLMGMESERHHLRGLWEWFRGELERKTGMECGSRSQIIPVHAGSAERAIAMADKLKRSGIMALPIRRPTVPAGGERLRLSLSATLSQRDLRRVLDLV